MPGVDSTQLSELYRRFGPAIHRRAQSILQDSHEALDVSQETFLAYMKRDWRQVQSPFAVLYRIATCQSVDRLRQRARWSGVLEQVDYSEERGDDPVERIPAEDTGTGRVDAAQDLALLTRGEDEDVLTAAFLYFVEGYTTDEVAQTLDVSRKTVGKQLARFTERARKRAARFEPVGAA